MVQIELKDDDEQDGQDEQRGVVSEADLVRLSSDEAALPRWEAVMGPAGTGKTFLMRERAQQFAPVARHVLCATTGIAAVNLGEGVTTINSLLWYYDTASLMGRWINGMLERALMRLAYTGVTRIVLDEVSMLSGEQLEIILGGLDSVNEKLDAAGRPPLSLTLTGDFCQLPPIQAQFAFEMPGWKRFEGATKTLTTVRRQSDAGFIQALQYARRGMGLDAWQLFGQVAQKENDPFFDGTTVLDKNDAVDKLNRFRLMQVKGQEVRVPSKREGTEASEWRNIPQVLELKEGALVLVLANRKNDLEDRLAGADAYAYVNGDVGMFVGLEEDNEGDDVVGTRARVVLKRTGEEVLVEWVTRKNLQPLTKARKKELEAQGDEGRKRIVSNEAGDPTWELLGTITYLPLRLGYATTVHKSQGLTLDRVQVDLRGGFFHAPGMVYVALSRARSLEGLRLVCPSGQSFAKRCNFDKRVERWL